MQLIIAEKPSLAKAIANGLPPGIRQAGQGFIRVGETVITHCFGHMYELAPPETYASRWQRWSIESLPITVGENQWLLVPRKDAEAQIKVIAGLLTEAKSVIHAGDPDREGQMLVDELLDALAWRGPTQRMLIYDTTPAGIRKALAGLRPNTEFAALFEAAKCRSRADWLVGMNLTRAASTRIGVVASIGRVQTPTLALVVRRDLAIEGHKSSKFYKIAVTVSSASETLTLTHDPDERITDAKQAQAICAGLNGITVSVGVTEESTTERAPLPLVLSTFQAAAEKRYGWPVAKALAALQAAYEGQLVSYPRTDCPYLPEEQARSAVPMAKAIIAAGHFPAAAPLTDRLAPQARIYDDKKVEQHHGLTPTTRLPSAESAPDAVKAWALVAEQFLASLLPDHRIAVKTAAFTHEGRTFKAKGETSLNGPASWRVVQPKVKREDEDGASPLQTRMTDGESAIMRVGQAVSVAGKTTPPKPYTEAGLISDMSAIHKYVTDPRIKAMLKETAGIGTPATQGAIIESLKARGYIASQGAGKTKRLCSTRFGRYLVAHAPAVLCDPGVTALWEEALSNIAKTGASPLEFMTRIDAYVAGNVTRIKDATFPRVDPADLPKGSKGRVVGK